MARTQSAPRRRKSCRKRTCWSKLGFDRFMPAVSTEQSGPVIKGIPVGNGKVTATARCCMGRKISARCKRAISWWRASRLRVDAPLCAGCGHCHRCGRADEPQFHRRPRIWHPGGSGNGRRHQTNSLRPLIRVDGDAGTVTLLDEVDENSLAETAAPKEKSSTRKIVWIGLTAGVVAWLFIRWRQRRKKRDRRDYATQIRYDSTARRINSAWELIASAPCASTRI